MKVIQLRGTNATGKTTAIRQFIEHGDFTVESFMVWNRPVEYHYERRRRIVVLGRYDKNECGGIDGYITDRNMLIHSLVEVAKRLKPETILFEGVVYGVTFQFAYDLSRVMKKYGYEYIGICLMPPLDVAIQRLAIRNGDKAVDLMSVQNKWFTTSRAYEKLKKNGVNVIPVDPSKIPKQMMWRIVENEL